jgi:cytochrome c biogenesis protein ResB
VQKNGQVVIGEQKAIQLSVDGKEEWITDRKPLELMLNNERVVIELTKKRLTLPFEFNLTRFKMDTNPGTSMAASYESFVKLFTKNGPEDHHIYMNNPLKYNGFTFYQSSYFQTNDNQFGSVLSANFDPGRPIKYFGSLILVLGAIWHYYIVTSKKKKKLNA